MSAERPIKVKLGKKDYLIPRIRPVEQTVYKIPEKLIRITDHPLDPKKLLVWRKGEEVEVWPEEPWGRKDRYLSIYEAEKEANTLREGERAIAAMVFFISKNAASEQFAHMSHFIVEPRFRRKQLGTAAMETMLQELRREGVKEVTLPPHKEEAFYKLWGFRKISGSYHGGVSGLGKHLKGLKLGIRWQHSRPRLAR